MTDRPIHVVGGGLAGLVAAVTAAESGAPVVLHEAADRLGGRALGGVERAGVNLGPHVVFTDGALVRWLRARSIPVRLLFPPLRGVRMIDDRGLRVPLGECVGLARTIARREAPADHSFRDWCDSAFPAHTAIVLCRLAGLFTFHHDPGSLSAAFVWERYRRSFLSPDRVRWVAGGWASLVEAVAAHATSLGVRIELGERLTVSTLPAGPVVVATPLPHAARLLEQEVSWPGARTALLDVVARRGASWPSIVADVRSDLSTCCMIERETAVERGLLGGEQAELFQAHLGIAPATTSAAGVGRIEDALDVAAAGWRERVVWQRGHVVVGLSGAVDPPGTTWRDRPRIDRGDDHFLAGDAVAAPGLLSEVAVNSAVHAARLALDARRRRAFAPGWPSVELTPQRRLAILASVLPNASLEHNPFSPAETLAPIEPIDETGTGYRIVCRGNRVRGVAAAFPHRADAGGEPAVITSLRSLRRPARLAAHRPVLDTGVAASRRWLRLPARR